MAMVPFLTLAMIGRRVELAAYQFHKLAFGITAANPEENAHGQITTLKAASIHPIVQNLPLGLGAGLAVFRRIRAGLAVATLWLHDRRDDGNYLTLEQDDDRQRTLSMVYRASPSEGPHLDWALGRLRAALGRMGAVVPRGMTRVLPHGASVHYGGTLPMAATGGPHTLTPEGRSRMFSNLVVADAAGFPFLPAKNHTFSLMANATRIAETVLP
jgi:choline dehydrogenase-like flavoprotein